MNCVCLNKDEKKYMIFRFQKKVLVTFHDYLEPRGIRQNENKLY